MLGIQMTLCQRTVKIMNLSKKETTKRSVAGVTNGNKMIKALHVCLYTCKIC